MIKAFKYPIKSGDTAYLTLVHKENKAIVDLPVGFDLAVGLFDKHRMPFNYYKLSLGTIKRLGTGVYQVFITNEVSKTLSGFVFIEITIYNEDRTDVKTSLDTLQFEVIPTKMNVV